MTNWITIQRSNQKLSHRAIYHISHFLSNHAADIFRILHCTMEFSAIKVIETWNIHYATVEVARSSRSESSSQFIRSYSISSHETAQEAFMQQESVRIVLSKKTYKYYCCSFIHVSIVVWKTDNHQNIFREQLQDLLIPPFIPTGKAIITTRLPLKAFK